MTTAADTARRERAEEWAKHGSLVDDKLWAEADAIARIGSLRGMAPTHAIVGYLAGAREEAEIKDREHCKDCCCARSWDALGVTKFVGASIPECIRELVEERDALREEIANHAAWAKEFSADHANGAIMAAQAEIAALREFVRWHFMHHSQSWPGNAEIMPAVHRALEETP